jgi:pyridinium-3,5-biscarboxylic acid mononucleotide sulfurtransferase
MADLDSKRRQLLDLLASYGSCGVAFSAGVDSTVLAKAAQLALGDMAVAVTGVSASLAEGEAAAACELAEQIGIRHVVIETDELERAEYVRNQSDRCFHCKTELYTQMEGLAGRLGVAVLVNGANVDDLGDYRPGMQAAREHRVESPMAECGLTKQEVRQLAAEWQLPVWNKPATPCLSSRIAYGEQVTPERLAMIDRAEHYLRGLGLPTVRVRYHKGDLARVEVPPDAISRLSAEPLRSKLAATLKSLGFRFVSLDLEGFRSGSLNDLIAPEMVRPLA